MKRTWMSMVLVSVSALALMNGRVWAQHEGHEHGEGQAHEHGQHEGEMSPEMMKAWETMVKLGTPGEKHENLDPLAGDWDLNVKWRMEPEGEWTEEPSTADINWMFGGRYLIEKVKGQPMPGSEEAFEGLGILGYDNTRQQYFTTWTDSMSTALFVSYGMADASGKVITLSGESYCPMAEKMVTEKSIIRIINNDKWVMEMHRPSPDGKLYKSMEITYTRK